jgi:hypothetical protein
VIRGRFDVHCPSGRSRPDALDPTRSTRQVIERLRHTAGVPQLCIAQDSAADELLSRDPLALVPSMLLDQHFGSGA